MAATDGFSSIFSDPFTSHDTFVDDLSNFQQDLQDSILNAFIEEAELTPTDDLLNTEAPLSMPKDIDPTSKTVKIDKELHERRPQHEDTNIFPFANYPQRVTEGFQPAHAPMPIPEPQISRDKEDAAPVIDNRKAMNTSMEQQSLDAEISRVYGYPGGYEVYLEDQRSFYHAWLMTMGVRDPHYSPMTGKTPRNNSLVPRSTNGVPRTWNTNKDSISACDPQPGRGRRKPNYFAHKAGARIQTFSSPSSKVREPGNDQSKGQRVQVSSKPPIMAPPAKPAQAQIPATPAALSPTDPRVSFHFGQWSQAPTTSFDEVHSLADQSLTWLPDSVSDLGHSGHSMQDPVFFDYSINFSASYFDDQRTPVQQPVPPYYDPATQHGNIGHSDQHDGNRPQAQISQHGPSDLSAAPILILPPTQTNGLFTPALSPVKDRYQSTPDGWPSLGDDLGFDGDLSYFQPLSNDKTPPASQFIYLTPDPSPPASGAPARQIELKRRREGSDDAEGDISPSLRRKFPCLNAPV